jgi:hypothetical protein
MPHSTCVEMPTEEHAERLAALRRARDSDLLARHSLWGGAAGRTPTDMAAVLFCSRSSVYHTVRAYREGSLAGEYDADGPRVPPGRRPMWLATLRRS